MSPPRASSQRTAVHCGPRYASGQQELPLRKAACTGLGQGRDSGGVQHTLRETEGVSPAKGFPNPAAGMLGKKRASGWCKGLDGSWLRQPVHPSPKQGCSEPHAGQGTEAGAGSQPCHSSWQIPIPPPGLCPRQGTKLQWSWGGTMPNLPGASSSAAGSSSHTCSLYPEGRVPATEANSGPAPLAVLVQGGQALPVAPRATTMRRKASGSGSSACRTHWRSAGGSALFPQSQVASEPGAVDSSHLSTPESGSGSGLS